MTICEDYFLAEGRTLGKAILGGGISVYKPDDVWYEEESVLRLSSVFRGNPYTYNRNFTVRNTDESEISGHIYVEVFGDKTVRLTDGWVSWRTPGDKHDQLVAVDRSKWKVEMYTTTNLAERLDHLPDYSLPSQPYDDWLRQFRVVMPGYQPRRFKVTLPWVEVNSQEWPIHPVEFDYKSWGIKWWTYP